MPEPSDGPAVGVAFGTSAGGLCLDRDRWGGNPFATAFIGLVGARAATARNPLELEALLKRLRLRTRRASKGLQDPECQLPESQAGWTISWSTRAATETRTALVLVVSDYSDTPWNPLPGAALDERRVASSLAAQGFSVAQGIAPTAESLERALTRFAQDSSGFDSAVIYSTGHGLMVGDTTYLIPGSTADGVAATRVLDAATVTRIGIPVTRMVSAARGRAHNLVLFAGCRRQVGRNVQPELT
jgi:Caspase domain